MKLSAKSLWSSKFMPLVAMVIVGAVGTTAVMFSHAATPDSANISGCVDNGATTRLPVLTSGQTGPCVRYLQSAMNNLTFSKSDGKQTKKSYNLEVSGTYDGPTEAAVLDFQKRLSSLGCTVSIGEAPDAPILADGSVGPSTWYFITSFASVGGYTSGSYKCGPGDPLS